MTKTFENGLVLATNFVDTHNLRTSQMSIKPNATDAHIDNRVLA